MEGFSEIVADRHAASLDESGRAKLTVIQDESRQLARMLDEMLATSRKASGS
jgi:hypothetical protein